LTAVPQDGAAAAEEAAAEAAAAAVVVEHEAVEGREAVGVAEAHEVAAVREVAVVRVAAALARPWDKLAAEADEARRRTVAAPIDLSPGQTLLAPMPIDLLRAMHFGKAGHRERTGRITRAISAHRAAGRTSQIARISPVLEIGRAFVPRITSDRQQDPRPEAASATTVRV
jgi:hypothetical protein